MPFDIDAARKAGKTDDQIASYLSNQYGFDAAAAMKAGKTSTQIAEYLAKKDRPSSNGNVTRDSILKREISNMSGTEKFLTGVGAGMTELWRGVQQKGAWAGNKLGLVSDDTVNQINQQGEEDRSIMRPLLDNSGAAQAGKVIGETVPTMAIPGGVAGGTLMRAGTAALSGGIQGALRFTGKDESTGLNTAIGALTAGTGSLALSGVSKGINAMAGRTVKTATQELGEKYKIPTTLGEDTGNATLQKSETLLERIPIVGTRKFREKQLAAADDAAKDFLGKYIADPENATIEGNRAYSSALYEKMKGVIKDVKDLPIYAIKSADKARELLGTFPDIFKKFQNVKREQIINDIIKDSGKGAVQPKTFDDMWALRDGLGEMIGQAKKKLATGDVDKTAISQLNALYKAVNDDIDKWAESVGKPELRTAINSANEAYKRYVVKYSLLQKAYDDAAGKTSAKEMFSPKTFSTSLKKIVAKDKEYKSFNAQEIDEMTGLANIMQVVKRAGQYAENPPTGNRMIDAALTGGGIVGAATQLGATAKTGGAIAASSLIAKFLTTTPAGKSLIMAASKVEPTSPAMQKIFDKIYQLAPRAAASMSLNDISMASSAEAGVLSEAEGAGAAIRQHKKDLAAAAADEPAPKPQPKQQVATTQYKSASNVRTNDAGQTQIWIDGDFDSKWVTLTPDEAKMVNKNGYLPTPVVDKIKKRSGLM